MPIQHTNRRKRTYYLHQGRTKAGNPKYFFSTKPSGDLAEKIPDGYEIYENPPNGQVLLRKIQPQAVENEERMLIERHVKGILGSDRFVLDVNGSTVTIFRSMDDPLFQTELFRYFPEHTDDSEWLISQGVSFSPMLRFILKDKGKRTFLLERFGFNGTIETWIPSGGHDTLEWLVKMYR